MKVSETFLSIQGEGPMQGRPAFFIRLAGCNLTCKFCDTKYAQKVEPDDADLAEIRDEMLELVRAHGPDFMFVITGGEPLFQQEAVETLLGSYKARWYRVANAWIETNGTIMPSRVLTERYKAKFVVSPKGGNFNRAALKALSEYGAHFKFVIDREGNDSFSFERALSIARAEFGVPLERIWMQPLGADKKELAKRSAWLWVKCVDAGVNFSPRTHIWVHGQKRGV